MAYRYPTIKVNGKTKLKHRHIAEAIAGRRLRQDEHVHHLDHNGHNPAPDNLDVMDADAHRKHHADERLIYSRSKACAVCGDVFTPHPTKRKRQLTCSRDCANQLRSRTEIATKCAVRARRRVVPSAPLLEAAE